MRALIEYTDTFGGEANYSWCRRYEFDSEGMTDLAIVRKAKALAGLSGMRGRMYTIGDGFTFYPCNQCTVMFIFFEYTPSNNELAREAERHYQGQGEGEA